MPNKGGLIGLMAIALTGCKATDLTPAEADPAAIARGREAALRLGCGACHVMPGMSWPKGRVGPDLTRFAGRSMIAGRLPNRPDILAAFVRNAPALAPGTAMPPVAMTDGEGRDIAAWLQQATR